MRGMIFVGVSFVGLYCAWQFGKQYWPGWNSGSFVIGVVGCGLIGGVLFCLNHWFTAIVRPYRPQVVEMETRETPNQISCAAVIALLQLSAFVAFGIALWLAFR